VERPVGAAGGHLLPQAQPQQLRRLARIDHLGQNKGSHDETFYDAVMRIRLWISSASDLMGMCIPHPKPNPT
jgi:hypothetical protein